MNRARPGPLKRVLYVRPKISCRACETIVQAPMPTRPIEKGRPGPALLAHVIVSKYCDHLPLHRQSAIWLAGVIARIADHPISKIDDMRPLA